MRLSAGQSTFSIFLWVGFLTALQWRFLAVMPQDQVFQEHTKSL